MRFFSGLADCGIFAPQHRAGREMTISRAERQSRPRSGRPKWRRVNGWFICAEPQAPYGAGNGAWVLRVGKTPCK